MHKNICIPRVDARYSVEYIKEKINKFQLGEIVSIKEIPLKNDANYKRILLKISWDISKEPVKKAEDMIIANGSLKLVYDMPWFWKIVETKSHVGY
jgi:hypothetical protein